MSSDHPGAQPPTVAIGMLGYAFMGKAHSNAFTTMPYMMWPPPAIPRLLAIGGRDEEAVSQAAARFGFERYYTDWRDLVADPEVQLFDNSAPNNLHFEPCIEAARAGKHVLCEKPLARSAPEAKQMLDAVEDARVKHMVAHNYRFVPALRLAYDLIKSGRIGEIRQFRGTYLQESGAHEDRPMTWRSRRESAGVGALGDLGSHTLDLARWLVGEIGAVSSLAKTFITERPSGERSPTREKVTVDDMAVSLLEFESGVVGTLEASKLALGRKNYHTIEVNGSTGSVFFNMERLNELLFYSTEDPSDVQGFHNVLVTETNHPFYSYWWPRGHTLGWEHTFVHEVHHFLKSVVEGTPIEPYGATFYDGYRTAVVIDGIAESSRLRRSVPLTYEA